jgi:hypothetical protein
MALRRQMINFIRLEPIKKPDEVRRVRYIAIMEKQFYTIDVAILIEVVNPLRIKV